MKPNSKISCIVCDRELDNMEYEANSGNVEVHPYDGLHFRTDGHYGSGIFDPMTAPKFLDLAICDLCVLKKLDNIRGTGVAVLRDNYDMYLKYATECAERSQNES